MSNNDTPTWLVQHDRTVAVVHSLIEGELQRWGVQTETERAERLLDQRDRLLDEIASPDNALYALTEFVHAFCQAIQAAAKANDCDPIDYYTAGQWW
jgi:hypothetical protein